MYEHILYDLKLYDSRCENVSGQLLMQRYAPPVYVRRIQVQVLRCAYTTNCLSKVWKVTMSANVLVYMHVHQHICQEQGTALSEPHRCMVAWLLLCSTRATILQNKTWETLILARSMCVPGKGTSNFIQPFAPMSPQRYEWQS